jgi:adenosylcobinamide-GDP ribazoletransferase
MTSLRLALSFLTILPIAPKGQPQAFGPARAWFPLVGLLLGGGLALLDLGLRQVFPVELTSALLLAALILATRALHVEGLVDCCDALPGGHTRERRLEILRDPHIGAFGVIGAVAMLLIYWAALVAIPGRMRLEALILYPCLSRWAMLLAMELFPYGRTRGLGTAFQEGKAPWQVGAGTITALGAALALASSAGLLLMALAAAVSAVAGSWMERLLGGLTGDCYGAINELASIAVLLLAVLLANEAASLYGQPFYRGA